MINEREPQGPEPETESHRSEDQHGWWRRRSLNEHDRRSIVDRLVDGLFEVGPVGIVLIVVIVLFWVTQQEVLEHARQDRELLQTEITQLRTITSNLADLVKSQVQESERADNVQLEILLILRQMQSQDKPLPAIGGFLPGDIRPN